MGQKISREAKFATASAPVSARYDVETGQNCHSLSVSPPRNASGVDLLSRSSPGGRSFREKASSAVRKISTASGGRREFLTDDQQRLIRQLWKDDLESLRALGATIYEGILCRSPEARHVFSVLKATPGGKLRESKEFKVQSLRLVQVIAYAVKHLDDVEACMNPMLREVGARHHKFVQRGFRPEMFNVFPEVMNLAILEQLKEVELSEDEKQQVVAGWKLLAEHIVEQMTQGFLQTR